MFVVDPALMVVYYIILVNTQAVSVRGQQVMVMEELIFVKQRQNRNKSISFHGVAF